MKCPNFHHCDMKVEGRPPLLRFYDRNPDYVHDWGTFTEDHIFLTLASADGCEVDLTARFGELDQMDVNRLQLT